MMNGCSHPFSGVPGFLASLEQNLVTIKQIIELNSYLPELLKDLKNVKFLDIGPSFLDEKGHLSKEMMPDTTHPSEKGHEVWAQAIEGELKAMLGR